MINLNYCEINYVLRRNSVTIQYFNICAIKL